MASTQKPLLQASPSIHLEGGIGEEDDGLSVFDEIRPRLFGIAFRMLRTVSEADDIVQDVWLRWQCTNRNLVQNPAAFLAAATVRLCINLLRSAQSRREIHVGISIPEPVDPKTDPAKSAEQNELFRQAILVVLERLSPAERGAYILREAFDYSHHQIADLLQIEEANSRQLVSRARKHAAEDRHMSVSLDELRRHLEAFFAASQKGNMALLEGLIVEDVVSCPEGDESVRGRSLIVSQQAFVGSQAPMTEQLVLGVNQGQEI